MGLRLGIVYTLLAFINVVFIAFMILENQSDLLNEVFHFRSDTTVRSLAADLQILAGTRPNKQKIEEIIYRHEIQSAELFDMTGEILFHAGRGSDDENTKSVSPEIRRKALETRMKGSVFVSPYRLKLSEENFGVEFIIPVMGPEGHQYFLHTRPVLLGDISERMASLQNQIALSVGWVIVFHLLFAVYAFRVYLRRISILTQTSRDLSQGELTARATWSKNTGDEIDILRRSFNQMADRLVDTIQKVQNLNEVMQYELSVGKEVQTCLLPNLQNLENLNACVFYRPLREVSGDIYEFYRQENGGVLLFFADASGHGVSAALVTAIAVMSFELSSGRSKNISSIFRDLNNILVQKFTGSLFYMTGILIYMDAEGFIDYINAGHPAPFLRRSGNGETVLLEATAQPLGFTADAQFEVKRVSVENKDRLLIYSDGLVETDLGDGTNLSEETIRDVMSVQNLTAQEMLDRLIEPFQKRSLSYSDDITAMMIDIRL